MTAPSVPGSLEKGERAPLLLGLEQLAQRERGWGEGCECEKCRHLFINNTAHPLPTGGRAYQRLASRFGHYTER